VRGASVIRQNPADFVRNIFELRPIHTASWEMAKIAKALNVLIEELKKK